MLRVKWIFILNCIRATLATTNNTLELFKCRKDMSKIGNYGNDSCNITNLNSKLFP